MTESGTDSGGVGSPRALREANRRRILDSLRRDGPGSQSEIARRTGLSRATVFNIVQELQRGGVLDLTREAGRTRVQVAFSRQAGLALGIDVDHRHLRVAVADLNHEILGERVEPLAEGATADHAIALASELIEELLGDLRASHDDVITVGMCLPAPVDPRTGQVGSTSILPGWIGVPAAETMQFRLGLPVVVDNDANLGALAEVTWGAARGERDVVYLKLATGIGAGLVFDSQLYHGAAGTAGEIGHTTVDERGDVCRCGNRGCLETYAGGAALLGMLRNSHGTDLTLPDLVNRAHDGDLMCQRVIADAGRHVGLAVANLCNLLGPRVIVIGGELAMADELLFAPLRDAVRRHAIQPAVDTVRIVPAALGDRTEVLGAIARGLRDEKFAFGSRGRAPPGLVNHVDRAQPRDPAPGAQPRSPRRKRAHHHQ